MPLLRAGSTTLSDRIGGTDGVVDTLPAFAFGAAVVAAVALVFMDVGACDFGDGLASGTVGSVFSLAESGSAAGLSDLPNLVTGAVSGLELDGAGLDVIRVLFSMSSNARGSLSGELVRRGDFMGSKLVFV